MPVLGKITRNDAPLPGPLPGHRGTPEDAVRYTPHEVFQADVPPSRTPPRALSGSAAERTCGAPSCRNRWSPPWKNRSRPIFEGDWSCSKGCLARLVEAAVRRETAEGLPHAIDEPHRHRVPLGLVLLAQGWITHPQLQAALEAQRASGKGRIGDWLAREAQLSEDRIARGLGVQWSCPVLSSDGFSPSAMALVMPKRFVAEFAQLPLRVAGSSLLYLAFEEQTRPALALSLEAMTGLNVESGLLPGAQFQAARHSLLAAEGVPAQAKLVGDRDELAKRIAQAVLLHQPVAARLVRVHQYFWLRLWLEAGTAGVAGKIPHSAEDMRDLLFSFGG